jgi:hypothetical protein
MYQMPPLPVRINEPLVSYLSKAGSAVGSLPPPPVNPRSTTTAPPPLPPYTPYPIPFSISNAITPTRLLFIIIIIYFIYFCFYFIFL